MQIIHPIAIRKSLPDTVSVVLTVAGALSLGPYQGGVHFGLTEFVRLSHDSASFRAAMGAAAARVGAPLEVPPFRIEAAGGASAGNINSVMTAIEWCRAPGIAREPEQSLFWRTWIRTGWEQLCGASPRNDRIERCDSTQIGSNIRDHIRIELLVEMALRMWHVLTRIGGRRNEIRDEPKNIAAPLDAGG